VCKKSTSETKHRLRNEFLIRWRTTEEYAGEVGSADERKVHVYSERELIQVAPITSDGTEEVGVEDTPEENQSEVENEGRIEDQKGNSCGEGGLRRTDTIEMAQSKENG
jgi:hypothetical protein